MFKSLLCSIIGHKYKHYSPTMKRCSCCGHTIITSKRTIRLMSVSINDSDWRD